MLPHIASYTPHIFHFPWLIPDTSTSILTSSLSTNMYTGMTHCYSLPGNLSCWHPTDGIIRWVMGVTLHLQIASVLVQIILLFEDMIWVFTVHCCRSGVIILPLTAMLPVWLYCCSSGLGEKLPTLYIPSLVKNTTNHNYHYFTVATATKTPRRDLSSLYH